MSACISPLLPPPAVAPTLPVPFHLGLQLRLKVKGRELPAVALVELILELDPVEAQRVQEGREQLHHAKDAHGHAAPDGEGDDDHRHAGQGRGAL